MLRKVYDKYGIECLETTPTTRCIKYSYWNEKYFVALPYVQYFKINNTLFVTIKNSPIQDIEEKLIPFPLTHSDAWICLPYDSIPRKNYNLKYFIELFWNTSFGNSNFPSNYSVKFGTLDDWQRKTKENPDATTYNWGHYKTTVDLMCQRSVYPHQKKMFINAYFGKSFKNRTKVTTFDKFKKLFNPFHIPPRGW